MSIQKKIININNNKNIIFCKNSSKINNNVINYNNDELNDLSYDSALKYDKRTFYQYYISILKSKHNLIFAFCNNEDYNPQIIKIDLFFIGFTFDYAINALFFNDDTMHKIYVNQGLFDWETQIPMAIYSFLISFILNTPLSFLGLSNDAIINFKQNQKKQGIKNRKRKLIYFTLLLVLCFYYSVGIMFQYFLLYIKILSIIY